MTVVKAELKCWNQSVTITAVAFINTLLVIILSLCCPSAHHHYPIKCISYIPKAPSHILARGSHPPASQWWHRWRTAWQWGGRHKAAPEDQMNCVVLSLYVGSFYLYTQNTHITAYIIMYDRLYYFVWTLKDWTKVQSKMRMVSPCLSSLMRRAALNSLRKLRLMKLFYSRAAT